MVGRPPACQEPRAKAHKTCRTVQAARIDFDATDDARKEHRQQKNEAVAEGKKLIAATDRQITELSKQAKISTGEVKAEHEKNMKDLEARKKAAAAQLDKMGKATSNAWDATKEGFTNAGKDLHAAYEKAAASAKK